MNISKHELIIIIIIIIVIIMGCTRITNGLLGDREESNFVMTKRKFVILIIKPMRCTNFSNLF